MASFFSKLWGRLHERQVPLSIMLIGLDNSGKTSILESLTSSQPFERAAGAKRASAPAGHEASPTGPLGRNLRADRGSSENDFEDDQWPTARNYDDTHEDHGDPAPDSDPAPPKDCSSPRQPGGGKPTPAGAGASMAGEWGLPTRRELSASRGESVRPTVGYNYERINYKGQTLNVLDFSGHSKYRPLWQEFVNCVDGIVFVVDSSDLIRLVVARDELETLLGNPYFASLQVANPIGANKNHSNQTLVASAPRAQQIQQKQITISQGKLLLGPLEGVPSRSPLSRHSDPAPRARTKVPILLLAHKTDLSTSVDTEAIMEALNLGQLFNKSRHPWRIHATSVYTDRRGLAEGLDWLLEEMSRPT